MASPSGLQAAVDAAFEDALARLDDPRTDGWEQYARIDGTVGGVLRHASDVSVWRRPTSTPAAGLYEYKAAGTLSGVSATLCQDVYGDLAYRKHWDSNVRQCRTVPEVPGGMHWVVKFPWPMSDRDYVFSRTARARATPHGDLFATVSMSVPAKSVPVLSDPVRVLEYRHTVVFAPTSASAGAAATRLYVYYFESSGSGLPSALVNTAVHAHLTSFARNFVQGAGTPDAACKNYALYKDVNAKGAHLSAAEQVKIALDEGMSKAFAGF